MKTMLNIIISLCVVISIAGCSKFMNDIVERQKTYDMNKVSNAESVAADKASLEITYNGNDTASGVTWNITLPTA